MNSKMVHDCWVQIEPPNEETGYPGRVAEGKFVIDGDTVWLTDQHGNPLSGYSKKIEPGDNPLTTARRLTKQRHLSRRDKDKLNFNRRLNYPPTGWM